MVKMSSFRWLYHGRFCNKHCRHTIDMIKKDFNNTLSESRLNIYFLLSEENSSNYNFQNFIELIIIVGCTFTFLLFRLYQAPYGVCTKSALNNYISLEVNLNKIRGLHIDVRLLYTTIWPISIKFAQNSVQ